MKFKSILRIIVLLILIYLGYMLLTRTPITLWIKIPIIVYLTIMVLLIIKHGKLLDLLGGITEIIIFSGFLIYSWLYLHIAVIGIALALTIYIFYNFFTKYFEVKG